MYSRIAVKNILELGENFEARRFPGKSLGVSGVRCYFARLHRAGAFCPLPWGLIG